MSETRTDSTQARPQGSSGQAAATGRGKHRGPAAAEDGQSQTQGRHRRPSSQER
ncbi:hypothetical protein AB0C51_04250 [Streptomyces pathocidini]|uniref:Uncharacterized protein n=1 Tax=Streptomyces pathocidini TaxID=1650571 RepID=A0ABW7URQ4_9ACTN